MFQTIQSEDVTSIVVVEVPTISSQLNKPCENELTHSTVFAQMEFGTNNTFDSKSLSCDETHESGCRTTPQSTTQVIIFINSDITCLP